MISFFVDYYERLNNTKKKRKNLCDWIVTHSIIKKARKDFINKQLVNKNRQKISPKRRYKMLVNFKKHIYRDETQE